MAHVEIGLAKNARRAYGFDEISIVPSRRTRDPRDVDITWELDAFRFDMPIIAAGMDSVVDPNNAITIGKLGGLACLNLEGLWTRYEDPAAALAKLDPLAGHESSAKAIYEPEIKPELIIKRIQQIKQAGVVSCASLTPNNVEKYLPYVLEAELDILVISGMVVTAEHKSKQNEPLNLKQVIRELPIPVIVGGAASYEAALHLMRTGAAAVLIGVGQSVTSTTPDVLGIGVPQPTAIADARAARMRHLDETGVYVQIIADGGMYSSGDIAKAFACGADAVMSGYLLSGAKDSASPLLHWGNSSSHATLPRSLAIEPEPAETIEEILLGPAPDGSGTTNLTGALRAAMAATGYTNLKELQKANLIVHSV